MNQKHGLQSGIILTLRIHVMGVWNSSRHTVQDIIPVFLVLSLWVTVSTRICQQQQQHMTTPTAAMTWTDPLHHTHIHFNVAGLLVVTEGTGELRVQVPRQPLLRRGLPFGLAATHCTPGLTQR